MIITVTLNAAIDKTLAVPNFRLGRRHRAVEQTSMAGGKGVNVARALKALGQPVIATGVAGGPDRHAHHRAAHRGGDPQRLRAHPRGVAHVDRGGRPDLGRADGDQRARPGGLRARAGAVRRQAPLPRPGRRDVRVLGQPAARRRARTSTRAWSRSCGAWASRPCSTPRASRCGWPRAPAPTWSRPTSSRPRSWWGTSSPTATTAARRVREMVEMGAREAIMTMPDGCMALLGADADAARPQRLCRATLDPLEPVSSVGSGDAFLAGYVAARYDGQRGRGVPALRRGLRRRVHPALRRRRARPAGGRPAGDRGQHRRAGRDRGPGRRLSRAPSAASALEGPVLRCPFVRRRT